MKRLLTLVALAAALTASAQVKVVKLWDNASAPHSNEDAGPQKEKNGNLYNTVDTELFIYPAAPDKATGQAVVVCPGVTIGENSIIGAGAVVTRSVPANSIAVGNPARVIKELDPNAPRALQAARVGVVDERTTGKQA